MLNPKKILVLAPHTDDGELGCGGMLAKFSEAGSEIYYAAFSTCAQSLPADLPSDTLKNECIKATGILGIPESRLIFFDFAVRNFPAERQKILDEMILMNKTIGPDLVLLPSSTDIHQDHQVIHEEGLRAFKYCSLLGYELPWNNTSFSTGLFVRLSLSHLEKKIAALQKYQSQSHRHYMRPDFIRSLATVRGVQSDTHFAEAFSIYRGYW